MVAFNGFGCSKPALKLPSPPTPFVPQAGRCDNALPLQNVRVTESAGESNDPSIVWSGSAFTLAWWDTRSTEPEVFTIGLRPDGTEASHFSKIPSLGSAKHPTLAFDGIQTDLVWSQDVRVLSARLNGGAPEIHHLSKGGMEPCAGAWGAAVWSASGLLYFRSDGMVDTKTGAPLQPQVIASGGIETPGIVYNGVFYAIVWSESVKGGRRIVMQRVSPKGERLGGLMEVSNSAGPHQKPVIAWNANRFAVAWTVSEKNIQSPRDEHHIYFALLPEVGDAPLLSKPTDVWGVLEAAAIATSGKEYALAWTGAKENEGCGIFFQRIDLDGNPASDILEVSDKPAITCSAPTLAWDGKGYGAAWDDDRGGMETEIYFSYIACGEHLDMTGITPRVKTKESNELPTLKEVF
jgi:hypothetical protein